MVFIKAELIADIKYEKQTESNTYHQTEDVQHAVAWIFSQISPGDNKQVFDHNSCIDSLKATKRIPFLYNDQNECDDWFDKHNNCPVLIQAASCVNNKKPPHKRGINFPHASWLPKLIKQPKLPHP